jgi:hypothetical protein
MEASVTVRPPSPILQQNLFSCPSNLGFLEAPGGSTGTASIWQ